MSLIALGIARQVRWGTLADGSTLRTTLRARTGVIAIALALAPAARAAAELSTLEAGPATEPCFLPSPHI